MGGRRCSGSRPRRKAHHWEDGVVASITCACLNLVPTNSPVSPPPFHSVIDAEFGLARATRLDEQIWQPRHASQLCTDSPPMSLLLVFCRGGCLSITATSDQASPPDLLHVPCSRLPGHTISAGGRRMSTPPSAVGGTPDPPDSIS